MLYTGYLFFFLVLTLAYATVMLLYVYGWRRLPVWQVPNGFVPRTTVTVLVPARNEAGRIGPCLDAIYSGTYPKDLLEVLVVDDHSTDDTAAEVASRMGSTDFSLRLIRLAERPNAGAGKKKAIETAVALARGPLIVTTDADCVPPPQWLSILVSFFESKNPAAIAGPVFLRPGPGLLGHFQALDFAGLMGITGAGIHLGWQRMGNGAHLAYPKAVFEAVGGYAGTPERASGDDLFLLQKIVARWPGRILFLKNPAAAVQTDPQPDWPSFFQQRLRWGTKNAALPETPVRLVLAVVFCFCWTILVTAALTVFHPALLPLLIAQLAIKAAADCLLLRMMCLFFGRPGLLRWFLPAFFLHIVYIAGLGTTSLFFKKYRWKERDLK